MRSYSSKVRAALEMDAIVVVVGPHSSAFVASSVILIAHAEQMRNSYLLKHFAQISEETCTLT